MMRIRKPKLPRAQRKLFKLQKHEAKFVKWLEKTHPKVATEVADTIKRDATLGDLGEMGGIFDKILDTVQKVAPGIVQAKAQKKILDMQMKRAEAGQPPLDASQYTPGMNVKVETSMAPMSTGTKIGVGVGIAATLALLAKVAFGKKKAA